MKNVNHVKSNVDAHFTNLKWMTVNTVFVHTQTFFMASTKQKETTEKSLKEYVQIICLR